MAHWFLNPVAGVLAAALALNMAQSHAAEPAKPRYELTDLGILPWVWVSDDVSPRLNAQGEVSRWQEAPNHSIHAFVWQNGVLKALGAPNGYVTSIATAVNAQGEIAGWAANGPNLVDSQAITHGFLYSGGKMRDLGTLGGRDSKAIGINESGEVVGWSSMQNNDRHAFRYRNGKLEDLGALPGAGFSAAYAINDEGVIAGAAETSKHLIHAVVWKDGIISDLGTLPGGLCSRALALNSRGDVVGFSEVGGAETHAFLYSDGRMRDLGDLGKDPVRADAINNRGQIVGSSGVGAWGRHAFLWENGSMKDVNKLTASRGDWRIEEATDIDDQSRILAIASHPQTPEERHLILLKPFFDDAERRISAEAAIQ